MNRERARQELKLVPIPVMQILVVVLFAFVMVHVQEVMIPFDCIPCGRERRGGPASSFIITPRCLAVSTDIICDGNEHSWMVTISYLLLFFIFCYAMGLMYLVYIAWRW